MLDFNDWDNFLDYSGFATPMEFDLTPQYSQPSPGVILRV
jgi:hypothetical protein